MRHQFGKTMKLHEIYEGYVRFTSVRAIASKILTLDKLIRWDGKCKQEDYDWLLLKCEDEGLHQALRKQCSRHTNHHSITYGEGEMLNTAHELASALEVLNKTKQNLDDEARTKFLQVTDEVIHSDEMRELAKQQAFVDLQNSYTKAESDSAKRVGALADSAVDTI